MKPRPRGESPAAPATEAGGAGRTALRDPFLLFLLATVFLAGFHTLIDPDIWFHLRAGQEIVRTGSIPRVDTFSYPSAGRPYIDLHWLYQVFMARVYQAAGVPGLTWVTCLLLMAAFGLVYRTTRRTSPPLLALVLTLLGAVLASERFEPRPEIFSFLFLALTLWLLCRHIEGSRRAAWILPGVFLLWVNSEGLFVLGYGVIAVTLLDRPRDRRLMRALGISVAVSLLNPYLVQGALHPYVLFTRINRSLPIYSATIGEFLSPFRGPALHPSVALFPFYLGLIGAGLLLCGRWPRISEILLLGAFVYLALSARRNLALLPLAATPVLGRWLERGRERLVRGRPWKSRSGAFRRTVTLAAGFVPLLGFVFYDILLFNNHIYTWAETNRSTGTGEAPVVFAREAAGFLRENRIQGPIFSTFSTGSYFTFAYPQEKVFIDGRLEVHSAEHYQRYLQILQGGAAWAAAERQFAWNAAVLQYMDAMPLTLERLRDPTWAPVHLDDTSIVFLKRTAANEALIARLMLTPAGLRASFPVLTSEEVKGALTLPAPPSWSMPFPLLLRQSFPWGAMNLGGFFASVGRPELAYPQFLRAVREAPGLAPPRLMLAATLNQMNLAAPALEVLDAARGCENSRSGRARAWNVRGDVLTSLHRPAEAVEAYTNYLRAPSSREQVPAVEASRAYARLLAHDPEGAAADIDQSLRRQPGNPQSYWILGQIEETRGHADAARRAYSRFKAMGGSAPEVDGQRKEPESR